MGGDRIIRRKKRRGKRGRETGLGGSIVPSTDEPMEAHQTRRGGGLGFSWGKF